MRIKGFIVVLENDSNVDRLSIFYKDSSDFYATKDEAREDINFFERLYPMNKDRYKIYYVEEDVDE